MSVDYFLALSDHYKAVRARLNAGPLRAPVAIAPPPPPEPDAQDIAALLDEAEDIVNAAGPAILAELATEQKRKNSAFGRLRSRFSRRTD